MEEPIPEQLLQRVHNYRMPARAIELLSKFPPLLIAGVSASGKGSVAERLHQSHHLQQVITHTTRQPRSGEVNGKDYWFVSGRQMAELLDNREMIEVKLVHGHHIYGSSLKAYQQAASTGQRPLFIVDIQGVEEITKNVPGLSAAFILPPSFDEWMHRMDKRGPMSHTEKARRLKSSESEIRHVLASKHFNIFVNRDVNHLAQAIEKNIIVPAEQHHNRDLAHRLLESIKAY